METGDDCHGVYQIAGTEAARHVIDDVTHHRPASRASSALIHHAAAVCYSSPVSDTRDDSAIRNNNKTKWLLAETTSFNKVCVST